jgi:hypothetical protein
MAPKARLSSKRPLPDDDPADIEDPAAAATPTPTPTPKRRVNPKAAAVPMTIDVTDSKNTVHYGELVKALATIDAHPIFSMIRLKDPLPIVEGGTDCGHEVPFDPDLYLTAMKERVLDMTACA